MTISISPILTTMLSAAGVHSQRHRWIISQLASNHYMSTILEYAESFNGKHARAAVREYVRRERAHGKTTGTDKLAARTPMTLRNELAAKKWDKLSEWLYTDKATPILRDDTLIGKLVSVEIECLFNSKASAAAAVSFWRNNNVPVTGKHDGSIRTTRDMQIAIELVFTLPVGDYSILANVCQGLNGNATVNKSCGLHVHFDRRHSDWGKTVDLANVLAGYVPALKQMLPESRRNNQYCKHSHNQNDRYSFINSKAYRRHGTLEIRGHSGTIEYTKIKNWIEIMQALISVSEQPVRQYQQVRSVNTLLKVLQSVGTGVGLLEYVKERAALFSGVNQHNEEPEHNTEQRAA
jgi:hypothetical protein